MRRARLAVWFIASALAACEPDASDPASMAADSATPALDSDAGGSPTAGDSATAPDARTLGPLSFPIRDASTPRETRWTLPDSSAAFGDADLWGAPLPIPDLPNDPADAKYKQLAADVTSKRKLDAAGVARAYPMKLETGVSYDPNTAEFMDRIQASALALSDGERAKLAENGFVISTRREFPTFTHGLAAIYAEHLPLYLSGDVLLHAVHRGHSELFKRIERQFLRPDLGTLLREMRGRLAGAQAEPLVLDAVDLYLSVALVLLDGTPPQTLRAESMAEVQRVTALVVDAQGAATIDFFATERLIDFSQFRPRGHYAGDLQSYFRAMMWLGRVDFRLLENEGGSEVFRRPQYEAMLLMQQLLTGSERVLDRIEGVLRTFVGESDGLSPAAARQLIEELGGMEAAKAARDELVVATLRKGGYGTQQIASQLVAADQDGNGMPDPLGRAYLLLGQRYVVDAHALSDAVHDRVRERLMANPLDAAFAALGNSQALALNTDVARHPDVAGALAATRTVIDAHATSFWNESFYNQWLRALRALSPSAELVPGLPEIARSEAWGRRVLNTQLGSWSELRHDAVLYAKQSYTGIPVCDYPDVYVDPYPELYRALHDYALAGLRLVERLPYASEQGSGARYFAALEEATRVLGEMAERELRGEPFSEAQLAFVNEIVRIVKEDVICSTIDSADGWYANLFMQAHESIEADLIVSDVHTQPADAAGNLIGHVLHVGTGFPRQLVATVDTCMGPRAYVGVVYAYHEEIATDFQRYQDSAWAQRFTGMPPKRPVEVPWLVPIQAR